MENTLHPFDDFRTDENQYFLSGKSLIPAMPEPYSILLVEDDHATAQGLALGLEPMRVVWCSTMRAALKALTAGFKADMLPDLILLDLGLSDSITTQTVIQIAILKRYRPVYVLSGESDEIIEAAAREAGAAGVMEKAQIDLHKLAEEITEIVKRDERTRIVRDHANKLAEAADRIEQQLLTNGSANGR